ncbi:putative FAD dependent oxidoreductase [Trichinella spiralis]|uniref:putative FAD dependent oxidoreductase n=1 Tax=Trichinella spiralis TaxID=6334 RepID=UPI0001EFB819|nr:putative FAD dependent oxidoreductase [Trichinella spiralis]
MYLKGLNCQAYKIEHVQFDKCQEKKYSAFNVEQHQRAFTSNSERAAAAAAAAYSLFVTLSLNSSLKIQHHIYKQHIGLLENLSGYYLPLAASLAVSGDKRVAICLLGV